MSESTDRADKILFEEFLIRTESSVRAVSVRGDRDCLLSGNRGKGTLCANRGAVIDEVVERAPSDLRHFRRCSLYVVVSSFENAGNAARTAGGHAAYLEGAEIVEITLKNVDIWCLASQS